MEFSHIGLITDEPKPGEAAITLANCPFHNLAERHTELVCGMNLDVVAGLIEALPRTDASARLDPGPGRCCVSVLASGGVESR